jgi:hypothetical protein
MSAWKKVVTAEGATADNSFITINPDSGIEVVRISDLPAIPVTAPITSAAEYLTDNSAALFFPVDDTTSDVHRKVSVSELAGMLTIGMINDVIDSGNGDISTFTNSETNLLGDFNGDGVVSTADLLQFLVQFGQAADPVFSNGILSVTNCPTLTSLTNILGPDDPITSDSDLNLLEISNASGNGGSFIGTVNSTSGNEYIQWEEGADIDWNNGTIFANKRLKLLYTQNAFKFVPYTGGAAVRYYAKVTTYNASDSELDSVYIYLNGRIAGENEAGQSLYSNCPSVIIGGLTNEYISLNSASVSGAAVAYVRVKFFVQNLFGEVQSAEIENLTTRLVIS